MDARLRTPTCHARHALFSGFAASKETVRCFLLRFSPGSNICAEPLAIPLLLAIAAPVSPFVDLSTLLCASLFVLGGHYRSLEVS